MLRFITLILSLFCVLAMASPVSAQISPFDLDDDEEKTDTDKKKKVKVKVVKKKKKKKKKKKDDEAEKEAEAAEAKAAAAAKEKEDEEAAAKADEEEAEAERKEDEEAKAEALKEKQEKEEAEKEAKAKKEAAAKALPLAPRIPLAANYDTVDLITINSILATGLTLSAFGTSLFGAPNASMRSPQLGSIDYDISISNHGDLQSGDPFLFGSLDIAAIAIPAGAAAYYLVSSIYYWSTDEPMLSSQSLNVDHALFGYLNAIGWTALAAGVTKLLVGREAPYSAFQRQAFGSEDPEQANTSFFSTTAAIGYAFAAFASRDLSDWLVHRKMHAASGSSKFWLGRVVPTASLYLLMSLTAYSSIRNQQHYFSDVAIGALVGTLFGNLSYSSHFDTKGQPRVRYDSALKNVATTPAIFTTPNGSPLIGASLHAEW